jgi:alpha-tubulin suppressor-like RCC1 family protein
MGSLGGRWTGTRRRLYLNCLVLMALAIVLLLSSVATALTLPVLGSAKQPTFSAGETHSLAIGTDGSLWAWGDNIDGQLGDGTMTDQPTLTPKHIGTATNWLTVSAGTKYSLGIKADGSLWAWGEDHNGQLGDGATTDLVVPTRVGTQTGWVAVAAGNRHSLALKSDGSLWAWGNNDKGQLGDGTTIERHLPTRIAADRSWVAIAVGMTHSLALSSDGSLWAWGDNTDGQLGDGTTNAVLVPTRIGTGNDWAAVTAEAGHSLALKSDGSLWAWGSNRSGELGDAGAGAGKIPSRIGTGTDWVAVNTAFFHTLALKSDGSLWAWGENENGQLGDGTTGDRFSPTRVGTLTSWVAVSGGGQHSLGMKSDGSLWAWGRNNQGQLGDGTTTNRLSPVQIVIGSGGGSVSAFPDVPVTNPYYAAISAMATQSIISGYSDGTFGPDKLVLRQHFAKMIVGAMGLAVTEADWQDATAPFTDCGPDDPASLYPHDYIAVAKAHGLTAGKTATTFAPEANITRAQMVTMVVRAAQNSGITLKALGPDYAGVFKNYSDPTHGDNVHLADYNGLLAGLAIVGAPESWIAGNATRGEVAQILWNLMQLPKN